MQTSANIKRKVGMTLFLLLSLFFGMQASYAQQATTGADAQLQAQLKQIEELYAQRMQALEAKIDAMKGAYEKRIIELESKVASSSTTTTEAASLRAEEAALKAEVAASRAEEMYASTIASQQASEIEAGGDRFAWRAVEDPRKAFEFHGMLRSNFGVNGNGGTLQVFQAPLTEGWYTLGNRNDTYGELIFINHFRDKDCWDDGVKFRTEVLIAYATKKATANGSAKDDKFSAREVFGEVEGLFQRDPGMKLWAGQRYYLNPGFIINNTDIANYSGYGCGFSDMTLDGLGDAKLSFAWIGGTLDDLTSDGQVEPNPTYAKNNLILSIDELPFYNGHLQTWAALVGAKGRNAPFGYNTGSQMIYAARYPQSWGFALGAVHTIKNFLGGFNQISLTFGRGAGANMSAVVNNPFAQLDDSWSITASESFIIQPVRCFSVGLLALAQYQRTGDPVVKKEFKDDYTCCKGRNVNVVQKTVLKDFTWLSFGVQPVIHLNKHVDIAFEGAVDWTNTHVTGGADGMLFKGTVALEVSPDFAFTAKPILRLFATAANWSDGYIGLVGGNPYAKDNGGYGLGASVEATW